MLARLDEDGSLALDWRLNVMQSLLLESSTDLAARQARAEDLVPIACMRWRYRDEYVALRTIYLERRLNKVYDGVPPLDYGDNVITSAEISMITSKCRANLCQN